MPEALARVRHDSILSAPARSASRAAAPSTWKRFRFRPPTTARSYAAIALTAVVAGILVNALTLQRERHPSPFFAAPVASIPAPPARVAAKAPAETPLAPPAPTSPALPPARPADLHAASETTSSIRSTDRIAEILRGAAAKDTQRVTAAAQTALVKLGYSVKVDGAAGADTLAALRDFEKEHGLPITTEITPHLVRRLAAANASASR